MRTQDEIQKEIDLIDKQLRRMEGRRVDFKLIIKLTLALALSFVFIGTMSSFGG